MMTIFKRFMIKDHSKWLQVLKRLANEVKRKLYHDHSDNLKRF